MKIKWIFFLSVLFIVGCQTQKPTVRTTKSPTHTRTVKKPSTQASSTISKTKTNTRQTQTSRPEILKATSEVRVTTETVKSYILSYKDIAKDNMVSHGVPASITLAQGILESGSGLSPLSLQANNHFGIKCHKEWTGLAVSHDDDEKGECFRKYDHPSESYRDHSLFLTSRPRYAGLFELSKDDYKSWARGLKDAGYATDPKYPDKLISLIERYELYKYDQEVLGKKGAVKNPNPIVVSNNGKTYKVEPGDTLYSVARKHNLTVDQLKNKNNLKDNNISIGQLLLID
jgi:flagellum-specific peptidoglycan hydrolase FlgJ